MKIRKNKFPNKPTKSILLSGGGTGGHIYPAIAIANALKKKYPDAKFLFVGASNRMEMQKIPQAGYPIKGLWISGLQRKKVWKNILFPLKIFVSLIKSFFILQKFKPSIVIGTGGFASGAILYVASLKKIPTLIQEQNSYAGLTNKLLSKKVNLICVAYPNMQRFFPKEKIIKTGNPVRQDVFDLKSKKEKAQLHFNFQFAKKKTLLVLGGSLGAVAINQIILDSLDFFEENEMQILWQTGKTQYHLYKKYVSENVKIFDFIQKMDYAYSMADFIMSRAGAGAISELALVGKPMILVPSPYVAEDHQTKNALAFACKNAAILLKQKNLKKDFKKIFEDLLKNENLQEKISLNLQKMAMPNATNLILDNIEKLIKNEF